MALKILEKVVFKYLNLNKIVKIIKNMWIKPLTKFWPYDIMRHYTEDWNKPMGGVNIDN
jgi:hypothetical protein